MLVVIDIRLCVGNFCFVFNCELFLGREQFFLCGSSESEIVELSLQKA